MTRQDQKVGEGGLAIQATGSVAISSGMTPDQMADLRLAWTLVRHVKSNAITIVKDGVATDAVA